MQVYLAAALDLFTELTGILGIIQKHALVDEAKINQSIEERNQAKKNKDFAKADAIRDEIVALGVSITDTKEGTTWKKQ